MRPPREDGNLTTKVWNDDQGYDQTDRAMDVSLDRLQLDYVDLYLGRLVPGSLAGGRQDPRNMAGDGKDLSPHEVDISGE